MLMLEYLAVSWGLMFDGDYLFQMVFAGMMFSSSIWGSICDKYGRKSVSIVSLYIFGI